MPEAYHLSPDAPIPKAFPADHKASFEVPDQKSQEAWEYYARGGRRLEPSAYQGFERRSKINGLIDRQISVISRMKMTSGYENERDRLMNEFQDWAPSSLAEGRAVLIGQQKRANTAANTPTGNGESALRDRVRQYQGYLIDAAHDLDALQSTLTYSEVEESDQPDPSKFRNSKEAQEVIIKQLMTRGFLWDKYDDRWPARNTNQYQEREKYWRGFVMDVIKTASDEGVAELVDIFYARAKNRFKYWNRVYAPVENMPAVRSLIEKGELMPLTAASLLGKKYQRVLEEEEPAAPDEMGSEPTDFDAMLSPKAKEAIARSRAEDEARLEREDEEYDAVWDREERKNKDVPIRIFERLATRGLKRALTKAEQFEADHDAEIREISERAAVAKPKKPAKKRRFKRYIGPRDSGAPEHIARQIRGSDL